jgi:putative transposase
VIISEKASEINIEIGALEVMGDHVHVFVSAPSNLSPHEIVKKLKGATSNILRKKYPELKCIPCLWSGSYYVGTVGFVSDSVVKNYIESQKGK